MYIQPVRAFMRPYLTEILIAFAAGVVIGHGLSHRTSPVTEEVQEIDTTPEAAKKPVQKREPMIQYGDGKVTFNIRKLRK